MTAAIQLFLTTTLALAAATGHAAAPDSTRTVAAAGHAAAAHATPADSIANARRHAGGMKVPKAPHAIAIPMARMPVYKFDTVTLEVRNRVFHDFRDAHRVRLNEDFPIGDTDFSARVIQYLPDFQMDLASRRYFSLTAQPNNPAFRIAVKKGKVAQDTTWAFLNNPPHFGAQSIVGFQVLRVDLPGRAPVLPDTTSRLFKPGGRAPGASPTSLRPDSARKP